jgi:nanoRNase/pAp phosphatase (c-di-AMP/oligoRNAs hydrolase)
MDIITTHVNADFDGLASMIAARKLCCLKIAVDRRQAKCGGKLERSYERKGRV